MTGVAKAAAKGEAKAAAPKTGPKTGKAGKAARPRSEIDDLITLIVCVACTIWACKAIIGLGVLSF
jgi:hypothetical protein